MAALGLFLPYVLPAVPGCPDEAARLEVRRACVQFCRETRVWQAWLSPVAVTAGQGAYTLALPSNAGLTMPEEVKFGDVRLEPLSRAGALEIYGETWDSALSGQPRHYVMDGDNGIALVPTPIQDGTLNVLAVLEPTQSAGAVPDVLLVNYPESIAHGALARLLAVPGAAWSNPQLAGWHGQQFGIDIGGYSAVVAKGRTKAPFATKSVFR